LPAETPVHTEEARLFMKTQSLLALLPVALIVACGGSSEFGRRSGPSPIALDALPEQFAKAQCDAFERCAGLYYDIVFTLEECSTLGSRQFRDGGFSELEQAIDDGRVKYDSKAAATCIEAISERACEDFDQRDIPECEDAVTGTVPADGECEIDAECEGSRICVVSDMCPGTCEDRGSAGFPCSDDDDCADGLVCSEATALCATPKQDGETCGGNVEAQCEGGLACQGESKDEMRTGTCTPFDELTTAGPNETCDLDAGILCGPDLSCTIVELADPPIFRCLAIPASGGTCGLGIPENCPSGEYCDLSAAEVILGTLESTCVPLPSSGEPCVDRNPFNGILAQCEAYARCDTSTGNCLALRDLGETCSSNELCYSQNCVNGGCAAQRACQ
jgi:hypothetical protein